MATVPRRGMAHAALRRHVSLQPDLWSFDCGLYGPVSPPHASRRASSYFSFPGVRFFWAAHCKADALIVATLRKGMNVCVSWAVLRIGEGRCGAIVQNRERCRGRMQSDFTAQRKHDRVYFVGDGEFTCTIQSKWMGIRMPRPTFST